MLLTHALALSAKSIFMQEKSLRVYVHSVRIGPTKLILVGTRITYQATGATGSYIAVGRNCDEDSSRMSGTRVFAEDLVGLGFLQSVSYCKINANSQKNICCGEKSGPKCHFLT